MNEDKRMYIEKKSPPVCRYVISLSRYNQEMFQPLGYLHFRSNLGGIDNLPYSYIIKSNLIVLPERQILFV